MIDNERLNSRDPFHSFEALSRPPNERSTGLSGVARHLKTRTPALYERLRYLRERVRRDGDRGWRHFERSVTGVARAVRSEGRHH